MGVIVHKQFLVHKHPSTRRDKSSLSKGLLEYQKASVLA